MLLGPPLTLPHTPKVRHLGGPFRTFLVGPFFIAMRPLARPVGASIFLVWGVSVRPSARLLINEACVCVFSTCFVVFFHCDAAAGRLGGRWHFSCLGHFCMTLNGVLISLRDHGGAVKSARRGRFTCRRGMYLKRASASLSRHVRPHWVRGKWVSNNSSYCGAPRGTSEIIASQNRRRADALETFAYETTGHF